MWAFLSHHKTFLVVEEFPLGFRLSIVGVDRERVPRIIAVCATEIKSLEDALQHARQRWAGECPRRLVVLSLGAFLLWQPLPSARTLKRASVEKILRAQIRQHLDKNEKTTPLGTILLRQHKLEARDMEDILRRQKALSQSIHAAPLRFGEIAVQDGYCTREDIQTALQLQEQQKDRFGRMAIRWELGAGGAVVRVVCKETQEKYQRVARAAGFLMCGLYPLSGCSSAFAPILGTEWVLEASEGELTALKVVAGRIEQVATSTLVCPSEDISGIFNGDLPRKIRLSITQDFPADKWHEAFAHLGIEPTIFEPSGKVGESGADCLCACTGAIFLETGQGHGQRRLLRATPQRAGVHLAATAVLVLLFPLLSLPLAGIMQRTAQAGLEYKSAETERAARQKDLAELKREISTGRASISALAAIQKDRREFMHELVRAFSAIYGNGMYISEVYEDISGYLHIAGYSRSVEAIEKARSELIRHLRGYEAGVQSGVVVLQRASSTEQRYPYHLLFKKAEP